MSVTNSKYFVFLIIVFFAFWLIAHRQSWRVALLLIANYLYYSQAGLLPIIILFSVSTIDFLTSRAMFGRENQRTRKILLSISLCTDIGVLCVFKYANFFVESATGGLSLCGLNIPLKHLNLIAPIGISFFIFQSAAYVVDVYRKDIRASSKLF